MEKKSFEILREIYSKINEHSGDRNYGFTDLCVLVEGEEERCYLGYASSIFDGILFEGKEYYERKTQMLKELVDANLVSVSNEKCTLEGYLSRYSDPLERDFYTRHLEGFIKGNNWLVGLENEYTIKGFMQEEIKLTPEGMKLCIESFDGKEKD